MILGTLSIIQENHELHYILYRWSSSGSDLLFPYKNFDIQTRKLHTYVLEKLYTDFRLSLPFQVPNLSRVDTIIHYVIQGKDAILLHFTKHSPQRSWKQNVKSTPVSKVYMSYPTGRPSWTAEKSQTLIPNAVLET